jgi:hypothetical protein
MSALESMSYSHVVKVSRSVAMSRSASRVAWEQFVDPSLVQWSIEADVQATRSAVISTS